MVEPKPNLQPEAVHEPASTPGRVPPGNLLDTLLRLAWNVKRCGANGRWIRGALRSVAERSVAKPEVLHGKLMKWERFLATPLRNTRFALVEVEKVSAGVVDPDSLILHLCGLARHLIEESGIQSGETRVVTTWRSIAHPERIWAVYQESQVLSGMLAKFVGNFSYLRCRKLFRMAFGRQELKLNQTKEDLIQAARELESKGKRVTAESLADAAGYPPGSHLRGVVAELRRHGKIPGGRRRPH